jgi:small subunit ribosomal protein S6
MRKYEAMVLVRPEISDSEVNKLAEKFKSVIEELNGTVESAGKWEKRKLAYPIQDYKEATYVLFKFDAESKVPAELNRQMRINENIIRHRIFLMDN